MRLLQLASLALVVLTFTPTSQAQNAESTTHVPGVDTPAGKRIIEKLNSIIIDKSNFDLYDLTKILPYLTKRSKELDPEHIGVKFVLQGPYQPPILPASGPIHREGFGFTDVPLIEVLDYYCSATAHEWKIEDNAVVVFPAAPKPKISP